MNHQNTHSWDGEQPSQEELGHILADHQNWVRGGMVGSPPHDLGGANLIMASFRGANLRGMNFSNSKLIEADLSRAILREADLSYADLSWANLALADTEGAVMDHAKLTGTTLPVKAKSR